MPEQDAAEAAICTVCGNTLYWHKRSQPHHQFQGINDPGRIQVAPPPPTPSPVGKGDPVLRLALVKAGVLTDLDIVAAESWLRAAAEQGQAVVVQNGEFKLLSIEEWLKWSTGQ